MSRPLFAAFTLLASSALPQSAFAQSDEMPAADVAQCMADSQGAIDSPHIRAAIVTKSGNTLTVQVGQDLKLELTPHTDGGVAIKSSYAAGPFTYVASGDDWGSSITMLETIVDKDKMKGVSMDGHDLVAATSAGLSAANGLFLSGQNHAKICRLKYRLGE